MQNHEKFPRLDEEVRTQPPTACAFPARFVSHLGSQPKRVLPCFPVVENTCFLEPDSYNLRHCISREIGSFRDTLRSWAARNNHDNTVYFSWCSRRNRRNGNHPEQDHYAMAQVLHRVGRTAVARPETSL